MTKNTITKATATTTTEATTTTGYFRLQYNAGTNNGYKENVLKSIGTASVLYSYEHIKSIADVNNISNYYVIRIQSSNRTNEDIRRIMNTLRFNPFKKEWENREYRYGILNTKSVSEIKRVFELEKRKMYLHLPYFYTINYYEKPIYGFYIIINNDKRYPLFGVDSAKQLDLYFTEGAKLKIGDTSIEVTPIYDDDVVYIMEEVIEAYASTSIEKWNEGIINKTILRAIEESFEDDEYI